MNFFSQLPYKCHQNGVASVGDGLKMCPWDASRVDVACSPLRSPTASCLISCSLVCTITSHAHREASLAAARGSASQRRPLLDCKTGSAAHHLAFSLHLTVGTIITGATASRPATSASGGDEGQCDPPFRTELCKIMCDDKGQEPCNY